MLKPLAEDPESVLRITMLADGVKTSVSPASDSKYILGYLPDLRTRMVRSVSNGGNMGLPSHDIVDPCEMIERGSKPRRL
jgi:hypothetical protein